MMLTARLELLLLLLLLWRQ